MSQQKEKTRLKMIRKERGYTQEQFAELLEMSTSGYKKLESGEIGLGVDKLQILNEKFGISADYVLYEGKAELSETWEKAMRLPEQEKWKLYMRMHAYLVRKTKDDMLIEEATEAVDKAVVDFLDKKDDGESACEI